MMWTVYIVKCADGSLYTGIAKDVTRRLSQHHAGKGAKYTATRLPLTLVWQETCATRSEALIREFAIKKLTRSQKEELIKG